MQDEKEAFGHPDDVLWDSPYEPRFQLLNTYPFTIEEEEQTEYNYAALNYRLSQTCLENSPFAMPMGSTAKSDKSDAAFSCKYGSMTKIERVVFDEIKTSTKKSSNMKICPEDITTS